jgi:hypothetical protein
MVTFSYLCHLNCPSIDRETFISEATEGPTTEWSVKTFTMLIPFFGHRGTEYAQFVVPEMFLNN